MKFIHEFFDNFLFLGNYIMEMGRSDLRYTSFCARNLSVGPTSIPRQLRDSKIYIVVVHMGSSRA